MWDHSIGHVQVWQHQTSERFYSLSSDQVKHLVPTVMLILWPSLTQLDLEEFCLACMLTCMPECKTGWPKSMENMSPKPFITDSRFTSSLLEAVIWHDISELFDSSILDWYNDLALIFFATGKKSWERQVKSRDRGGKGETKERIERKRK